MKNYLVYKITYALHRLGFYFYSVKYYIEDNYKKKNGIILNILNFFRILIISIFKQMKIFNYKFGYYEYIEIPITTRCTLRCKSCSNLIPCYKKPYDANLEKLFKSIDVFLECINNIVYIRVLGGEPFLSKNLDKILEKLLSSDKIQRIEVVTNGTLVPSNQKLLEVLSNKRIIVCISKYPNVKSEKLIEVLEKNSIKYRIDEMDFWMEYGNLDKRNKSFNEAKKQYKRCRHVCKSLINGQLHLCPRSGHGTDLGVIQGNENDYLDLLDDSIINKKESMVKLFKKKAILACNYCDFATSKCKKIKVAEQIK